MTNDNNHREFYCFISYKHRRGDQFIQDDKWAESLATSLIRLHIPTDIKPPIDDHSFINLNPKDAWVEPVFRDFEVLPVGGKFDDRIKDALKYSRFLVVIITDEMIQDQDRLLQGSAHDPDDLLEKRYENAWCYREIFTFLKNHTREDIIPVYIGERDKIEEILPRILTGGFSSDDYEEKRLNEEEAARYTESVQYWKDRNIAMVNARKAETTEDIYDFIAAKIAARIFGTDADQFDNYRKAEERKRKAEKEKMQAEKESLRKSRLIIILVAFFSIILLAMGLIFASHNRKRAEAFRLLDQARWEYDGNNALTAMKLSSEALKKDKKNFDGLLFAEKLLSTDYSKPIFLRVDSSVDFNPRTREFYEFDQDHKQYVLRDLRFHQTGEQVSFKESWFYPISSSEDGTLLAIPDYDSVYVYDRAQKAFIFSTPYDGGWRNNLGEVVFDGRRSLMARMTPWELLIHDLKEKQTTVIPGSFDKIFSSGSDICLARFSSDSLIIERVDPQTRSLSAQMRWALPDGSSENVRQSLTVSPNGKELTAWTGTHVLCFNKDGIEDLVFADRKPLRICFDDQSERMAIIHDEGSFIQLFRNHRIENGFYTCDGKQASGLFWGNNEDLILDCGDVIYVYNPVTDTKIALDASMVPKSDRLDRRFYCDKDYLILSDSDISSTYAAFPYPKLEWITNKYSYPEYMEEYFHASVDETNTNIDYPDIDRKLVFGKDRIRILSLSGNTPIGEIVYPRVDPVGVTNVLREGKLLFCNLRYFLPSDIGSMKGFSIFLQIDLETGKSIAEYSRKGCYDHLLDDGAIILSEAGYDGSIIKLTKNTLQPVDSLFLGEFITNPPFKCADGSYLAITKEGHLFHFDFPKRHVEKVSLPLPAEAWNNYIFDNRYLELNEAPEKGSGRYLYDLNTRNFVLYLLPEERIISLDGDHVQIWYSHNNQHLYYTRKLLDERTVRQLVEQRSKDWD